MILEYVVSWLPAQKPSWWRCRPKWRELPERLQELLGYNVYPPFLGYVDGRHPGRCCARHDRRRDPGLAEEYWEAQLEASPLFATYMGDHRYDDRVDDLSVETEQARRATWTDLEARAAALDGILDETGAVTRDLLLHELDDAAASTCGWPKMTWDQMEGVHADLLIGAGQLNAHEPERAAMA